MARYIDVEKTADAMMNILDGSGFLMQVLHAIKEQTTADVAPVVRCKDCQYWQDNNGGYPHPDCRWGHEETPDENDFCSYGERKDCDG